MNWQETVITGEQNGVYQKIQDYFDRIQTEIDRNRDNLLKINPNLMLHPQFERRSARIQPLYKGDQLRPEDALHMLLYQDKVVAVVTEQRDEFNYVQFSFFDRLEEIVLDSGSKIVK